MNAMQLVMLTNAEGESDIRAYTFCAVPNNSRRRTPFEILHFRTGKPFSFPYPGL